MRVIVTGASSGIGKAVCEHLLAAGHQVVGVSRRGTPLAPAAGTFHPWALDLADLPHLPARLQPLAAVHPALEALVCCAGAGRFGGLEQFNHAQIRQLVDLNFTGQAFLVRSLLPALKRAGHSTLVFVGSEAGRRGRRRGAVYCATKFALRGFAEALREELASSGVRVCLVNPGMVRTPFYDGAGFAPRPGAEHALQPTEVAQVVTQVITARSGVVFDEVYLTPLTHAVDFSAGRPPPQEVDPCLDAKPGEAT